LGYLGDFSMAAGDWRNMLIFLCGRKSSTLAPKDKRDDAIYRLPAGRQVQLLFLGSWLNPVARRRGPGTDQAIHRGAFRSV
jgi:hypothetical protein